jgi:hypothetical protein
VTAPDPLPLANAVRRARRSSTLACGHHVHPGHVIVRRGGKWTCLECALDAIRTSAASPAAAAGKKDRDGQPVNNSIT